MLGTPTPARRRLATAAVVVVLVVAVVVAIVVRNARDDLTPVRERGGTVPVLLVPGYAGTLSALEPLRTDLEARGRDVVVVPAPGDGTGDLRAQAANLGRAARKALQEYDARTVDVVGYSAGGVVARLWVRDGGGAEVARRVLTIGSPHHGSDVARLVLGSAACPAACRQLAPGSDLLRALNQGDETPRGPEFVSMWSQSDAVSTPPGTARLEGALNIPVQSVCPGRAVSHGSLPVDPVVLAALGTVLGKGDPTVPADVACGG